MVSANIGANVCANVCLVAIIALVIVVTGFRLYYGREYWLIRRGTKRHVYQQATPK